MTTFYGPDAFESLRRLADLNQRSAAGMRATTMTALQSWEKLVTSLTAWQDRTADLMLTPAFAGPVHLQTQVVREATSAYVRSSCAVLNEVSTSTAVAR